MSLQSGSRFTPWKFARRNRVGLSIGALLALSCASVMVAQFVVKDPGVRNGTVDSGGALASVASTGASD